MQRFTDDSIKEFETRHNETLRRIAAECAVLLKKNGDFPLNSPCKAALYGNGASWNKSSM